MLSGALVAILRSVRPLWECHTHLNFGYMIHDKTLVLLADEMILTFLGKLAPLIDGNAVQTVPFRVADVGWLSASAK